MSDNDLINLDGMVYISGKITGTDDFMERFATAAERLNSAGYVVCNPASLNATMPSSTSWEGYMGESLRMLSHCAAIYMLRGWEESRGARVELSVALQMGKRVMFEDAPAVPQEMSAKELLHAERRMYNEDSDAYLEYSSLVIEEEMESALCYIEAWAREHPEKPEKRRKTYAEDFKERCPNHLHNCGMPIVCRNEVYGFGGRCTVEEAVKRGGCSSCWNAEMEGEDE